MFWVKRSLGTCCRSVSHEGQGVWGLLCAVTTGADPGALRARGVTADRTEGCRLQGGSRQRNSDLFCFCSGIAQSADP